MKVPVTDPKELAFRDDLLKAITKANQSSMGIDRLVITILELTEVVAEGCILATNGEPKRKALREILGKVIDRMAKRVASYVPDPDIEAKVKAIAGAEPSAWSKVKEDLVH